MQCCLAGLPGLVRGARARQLPHGVTSPAGVRSLSRCLCHVPGMPLHVPRAARHRVADAIAMGRPPGIHGGWDSRIGTDLTRGPPFCWFLKSDPFRSSLFSGLSFPFSCQNGAFFIRPSDVRVMGILLTLNYFDIYFKVFVLPSVHIWWFLRSFFCYESAYVSLISVNLTISFVYTSSSRIWAFIQPFM